MSGTRVMVCSHFGSSAAAPPGPASFTLCTSRHRGTRVVRRVGWQRSLVGNMEAFLRTVDAVAPVTLLEIIAGLTSGGFTEPGHLDQADAKEVIDAFPADGAGKLLPAGKAFIRRAIVSASQKQETTALALLDVPPPLPRAEHHAELFGS